MRIKSYDRLFICGKTGSGKSYFGIHGIIKNFKKIGVVVIDLKYSIALNELLKRKFKVISFAHDFKPKIHKNYLFRPANFDGYEKELDKLLIKIFSFGNYHIFFDELVIANDSYFLSAETKRVLRQGRERGVGCSSCTQKPSQCNSLVFDQAEHFIIFKLLNSRDKTKVSGWVSDEVSGLIDSLKQYEFVYFKPSEDTIRVMKLVFGKLKVVKNV